MDGDRQASTRRDVDGAAARELLDESPRVYLGGLVVVAVLHLATWLLGQFHPLDLAMLVLGAVAVAATWRRMVPASVLPWMWSTVVFVCIVILCVELVDMRSTVLFGYLLVLTAAFPPLTLLWRPTIVFGCLIVVAVAITAISTANDNWGDLTAFDATLQSAVAVAAGMVALYFRRRSLAAGLDVTTRLEVSAQTDRLTGVLNRRGVEERGATLIAGRRAADTTAFALFIDVDGLKAVNDTRGHDAGDAAIRAVAEAAGGVVRAGDLLGRWGGDEFVILGIGALPDPVVVEERIRERLRATHLDEVGRLGVSVGGAVGTGDLSGLLAAADADMYARRARSRGADPVSEPPTAPDLS